MNKQRMLRLVDLLNERSVHHYVKIDKIGTQSKDRTYSIHIALKVAGEWKESIIDGTTLIADLDWLI